MPDMHRISKKVLFFQVSYTLIAKYVKMNAKCEKQKVYSGVFCATFFLFCNLFFAFRMSQHLTGSAFA